MEGISPPFFMSGEYRMFYTKSVVASVSFVLAIFAIFTMFEILGKSERIFKAETLKIIHKINGAIFFIIFFYITVFCLKFIINSQSELNPRGTFHAICAFTILILFALKVSIIHIYKQFYGYVRVIGISIAIISFNMIASSAGFYLLVSKFGSDKNFDKTRELKIQKQTISDIEQKENKQKITVKIDKKSISKGKVLYEEKCSFCHEPNSTNWTVGPGHKGIMKMEHLPVSKKPPTPENIANQIKNPIKEMPSFSYLSDEDIENIIAYLNTL